MVTGPADTYLRQPLEFLQLEIEWVLGKLEQLAFAESTLVEYVAAMACMKLAAEHIVQSAMLEADID